MANVLRHPIVLPRYLNQRRKLLGIRYRQRHNRGIFSVDIDRSIGFFAQLTWCAYILSYCDESGLIPHVTSSNRFYVDAARGPDCLGYFFENPRQEFIDAHLVATARLRIIHELGLPTRCIAAMTLERAGELVRRHMRVRPKITAEVDRFAAAHFGSAPVLGVHFRGTDKTTEAMPVAPERMAAVIRAYLNEHREVKRLFVATDVVPFLDYIRDEFRSVPILSCDDQRSDGTVAVHRAEFGGDNYRKGFEAVLNCLLLSRCSALVRTASTLSAWASVFNPRMPVVMVNRPLPDRTWFPDRSVIQRATMADG